MLYKNLSPNTNILSYPFIEENEIQDTSSIRLKSLTNKKAEKNSSQSFIGCLEVKYIIYMYIILIGVSMSRVSRRECLITGLKSEDIDLMVDDLRAFLKEERLPEGYIINVYKDFVACCGVLPLGIVVEIEGPSECIIEDLDRRLYAKIIEICEQRGIEQHKCEPMKIA